MHHGEGQGLLLFNLAIWDKDIEPICNPVYNLYPSERLFFFVKTVTGDDVVLFHHANVRLLDCGNSLLVQDEHLVMLTAAVASYQVVMQFFQTIEHLARAQFGAVLKRARVNYTKQSVWQRRQVRLRTQWSPVHHHTFKLVHHSRIRILVSNIRPPLSAVTLQVYFMLVIQLKDNRI